VQPPLEIRQLSPLRDQLEAFLAAHQDPVISRNRIINPLLELWDVVQRESPEAALPIERLLSALAGRLHTSADELARMVEEVACLIPDRGPDDRGPDMDLTEDLRV
jgi:hypothetical protein